MLLRRRQCAAKTTALPLFSVTLDVGVLRIEDDPYRPVLTVRHTCHVIRGLTDKFNHHRVKVYHLHTFCLAKVELGLAHHFLRSAAATHTEARTRREIERRDSDNASTDTHKVVKIPVLASILVNTVGYVLS